MLLIEGEDPERLRAESGPSQVVLAEKLLETMGRWFRRNTGRGRGLGEAVLQPRDKVAWAGVTW